MFDLSLFFWSRKQAFLHNISLDSLDSTEHRLREFIEHHQSQLHHEIKTVHEFIRRSESYRILNTHINSLKKLIYGAVLFLNLVSQYLLFRCALKNFTPPVTAFQNILLSPDDIVAPGKAFIDLLASESPMDKHKISIVITFMLGFFSLLGYFAVAIFLALTNVPLTLMNMDQLRDRFNKISSDGLIKRSDFYDFGALEGTGVSIIASGMCILIYEVNFDTTQSAKMFYPTLALVNLFTVLSTCRNFIVVPHTKAQRLYCLLYDVVVRQSYLRNNIVLMILAMLGFFNSSFFTLMLMDIMNLSPVLFDVLKAISLTATNSPYLDIYFSQPSLYSVPLAFSS